ncbi:MAG: DNA glycosylase AlkZ-like family protein, partial [Streptosporangiales bacterium]
MNTTGRPAPPSLAAQRLHAQLLSGAPARTVAGVTGHLLAIQAQDPRGARLAVRARTSGLLATDVDDALTADRSVVVSWLNRGTLHLVLAEDYWWLHQLTTPQLATGNARRLAQEGVPPADADRAVGVIERSLAADGPLTRAELRERVTAAGVRTVGQAMVHILALATLRVLTVRGPMRGGE